MIQVDPSDSDFRLFLDDLPKASRLLCERLMLEAGEIPAALLIIVTEQQIKVVAVPLLESYAMRSITAEAIRTILRDESATAYSFCTECWMRSVSPDEDSNSIGPIRDHPDRVEGVTIAGQTAEGNFAEFLETKRGDIGQVVALAAHPSNEAIGHGMGIWTDLLYRQQAN